MRKGDQYVQILPSPSFVVDLDTEDLYFTDKCGEVKGRGICDRRRTEMRLDTAYWNLHGLPMLRHTGNVTVKAPVVADLNWLWLDEYPLSNHTKFMPSGILELKFPPL